MSWSVKGTFKQRKAILKEMDDAIMNALKTTGIFPLLPVQRVIWFLTRLFAE